jgi:DNA-directed RNA polymerase subunit RPC12/RpoP
MFEGSGFQATYEVTAKRAEELTSGSAYFGFVCAGCGTRFAVWNDPSAGAERFTSKRPCVFKVSCPHCAAARLYRTDQVQPFTA